MITPIAAVKSGFRQYFRFGGRATRPEFWWWMLFIVIASIVLDVIDRIIDRMVGIEELGVLSTLFGLATLLPSLAVTSRRLHDIGKSGWWQLAWCAALALAWGIAVVILFIGLAFAFAAFGDWILTLGTGGDLSDIILAVLPALLAFIVAAAVTLGLIVWAIIWMARQGESGENRYGPDPRTVSDDGAAFPELADRYTDYPRSD